MHQRTPPTLTPPTEPPKLLSLAAQSSLQAMLPSEDQSSTQTIPPGKPTLMSSMQAVSSQMASVHGSSMMTSSGASQSYIPPFGVSCFNLLCVQRLCWYF